MTDRAVEARVRILGPAELEVVGRPVPLPAPKERGLLVVLALRPGSAVSSHELADVLWGDAAPEKYRKSLQVLVSRVRRRIQDAGGPDGHDLLVTAGDAYLLRVAPDAVDAVRLEGLTREGRDALAAGRAVEAVAHLEEALALWRGDPVPEVAETPAGRAEAARLAEMRRSALEHLHEAELALGRHGDLVARLEVLVAAEPLHEQVWRQLMLALYRSGRQADALRAYQRARTTLVDELGIEPGPELRRLESAIVAQDPALDWVGGGGGADRGQRDGGSNAADGLGGLPPAPVVASSVVAPRSSCSTQRWKTPVTAWRCSYSMALTVREDQVAR